MAEAHSPEWLDQGATIATVIDRMRWMLADWAAQAETLPPAHGKTLPPCYPLDAKAIRKAAGIARAFPRANRHPALTYDVLVQLARLPADDRAEHLATAAEARWTLRQATNAVSQRRAETASFVDEDPERLATLMYRAWNNAPADIREHAWELLETAARKGFTIVDETDPDYG